MQITIAGKQLDLSDALRTHVSENSTASRGSISTMRWRRR